MRGRREPWLRTLRCECEGQPVTATIFDGDGVDWIEGILLVVGCGCQFWDLDRSPTENADHGG